MVGIDLDGTLLAPSGKPSARTINAVISARKAGIHICIATGRSYREAVIALKDLEIPGFHVFAGGSMVIERTGIGPDDYRVAAKQAMPGNVARTFCSVVEGLGHSVQVLQDPAQHPEGAQFDMLRSANQPMDDRERVWLANNPVRLSTAADLQTRDHADTVRCSCVVDSSHMFRVESAVQDALAGRASWHVIRVPTVGVDVLECFGPGVNKWSGLQLVGKLIGVDDASIAAAGDDVNDVDMIKHAGRSFAMGNAIPAIKELADEIIESNSNDGIARLLESWCETR